MIPPMLIPAGILLFRTLKRHYYSIPAPERVYAENVIALIGSANAGKSSLGNQLVAREAFRVGPVHGVTRAMHDVDFGHGYLLRDTPGLLDDYSLPVLRLIRTVRIIIYVTDGQVYRPELEALKQVKAYTDKQGALGAGKRHLMVFCNKQDTRVGHMPRADVATIDAKLREQVAFFAPPANILFGSTRPDFAGSVQTLKTKLTETIQTHG